MRTVSSVSPAAVRLTITLRRRCRSMPTYCRSIGVFLPRRGLVVEDPSVATLTCSGRAEAPPFFLTGALVITNRLLGVGVRPVHSTGPSRESDAALLHDIKGECSSGLLLRLVLS